MRKVEVIQYIANDGAVFQDAERCHEYEQLLDRVAPIEKMLETTVDISSCAFANGSGFVQHDPETFEQAKRMLLEIALERFTKSETGPYEWIKTTMERKWSDNSVHPSWAARAIDEVCQQPIKRLYSRLYCTDSTYREWGQPYFADHPEEATQERLN